MVFFVEAQQIFFKIGPEFRGVKLLSTMLLRLCIIRLVTELDSQSHCYLERAKCLAGLCGYCVY